MDPVTLISTVAISGAALIGKKTVETTVEELWSRFKSRLQSHTQSNAEAANVLDTLNNAQAVKGAVAATDAAIDTELLHMANQLSIVFQRTDPVQYQQFADKIINIQINYGSITM